MERAKLRRKALKSLMDEINILKNLNSPYVIKVYDVIKSPDHFYIITEFCNGGNLEDKLQNRGYFNEKDVSLIFGQVLQAMKAMRDIHAVHRDIKNANILLHFEDSDDQDSSRS